MKKKLKFSYKNLFKKNTPKWIKRIANAILGASIFGMGFSFIETHRTLALILLLTGVVAKFLSEFFGENQRN